MPERKQYPHLPQSPKHSWREVVYLLQSTLVAGQDWNNNVATFVANQTRKSAFSPKPCANPSSSRASRKERTMGSRSCRKVRDPTGICATSDEQKRRPCKKAAFVCFPFRNLQLFWHMHTIPFLDPDRQNAKLFQKAAHFDSEKSLQPPDSTPRPASAGAYSLECSFDVKHSEAPEYPECVTLQQNRVGPMVNRNRPTLFHLSFYE